MPESGLDCLICAIFARQRAWGVFCFTHEMLVAWERFWEKDFCIDNLLVRINLNHRDDFSRPALRHESLNSLFQVALHLPSYYNPEKWLINALLVSNIPERLDHTSNKLLDYLYLPRELMYRSDPHTWRRRAYSSYISILGDI